MIQEKKREKERENKRDDLQSEECWRSKNIIIVSLRTIYLEACKQKSTVVK